MKRAAHGKCGEQRLTPSSMSPHSEVKKSSWRSSFRFIAERAMNWGVERLLTARVGLLGLGHLALFSMVYWLAFLLRFGFAVPPASMNVFWLSLPWVLGTKLAIFWILRH